MTLNDILIKLGVKSNRTINITKHIGLSFLFKLGAILANFMLVPITINYLGTTNYGIWLIITSFVGWFTFFDVGLGHGLRNKFAEAKAKGDMNLVKAYVSSAYFTLTLISIALFFLFFTTNFFIDWTQVFNTEKGLEEKLSFLMLIVFSFFCLQLIFKLITTIYTADQKPSISVLVNFLTQFISLITVWLLLKYTDSSLFLFGLVISLIPILILIGFNLFSFRGVYKDFSPTIKLWKKKYIKDIFGLGVKFFIIQIAAVILYTTDNLIITHLFSPKEVVPYNLSLKYFSIISMSFSIIVAPYWSAITDAYTKKDFKWIKTAMKNLLKFVGFFSIITIIMVVFAKPFYKFWLGDAIFISGSLSLFMGIFVLLSISVQPFVFFINGTGKIKLQLILGSIMAVINIPLSIFLAKNLDLGSKGVILATIICCILTIIFYPIQYIKIINNKAKGIWNE